MEIKDIIELITNIQRTRNAGLASLVLLVYDHVLTFQSEVELVWFKPWSWSSALFLWNRYGTLVILMFDTITEKSLTPRIVGVGGGPNDSLCLSWQKFQGWTGWLTNMTVEIRIAAMFLQDRRIVAPVLVLFFAQAIAMAVIIGFGFASMKAVHEPVPGLAFRACALLGVPPMMFLYWAINLGFESVLFTLAIIKASQHLARRQGMRPSWSGPRILSVLVRDSIIYFLVIFITYIMNLVAWTTGGRSLYQLAISLAIALADPTPDEPRWAAVYC
ncbi:hypothetical protein BDV93DRAFT_503052 [Ceratobasidium sp. AG-I]|nr:hypothetical protein BDV93DRAFT_503052 [Ceratobasidium sp. AG-I]